MEGDVSIEHPRSRNRGSSVDNPLSPRVGHSQNALSEVCADAEGHGSRKNAVGFSVPQEPARIATASGHLGFHETIFDCGNDASYDRGWVVLQARPEWRWNAVPTFRDLLYLPFLNEGFGFVSKAPTPTQWSGVEAPLPEPRNDSSGNGSKTPSGSDRNVNLNLRLCLTGVAEDACKPHFLGLTAGVHHHA